MTENTQNPDAGSVLCDDMHACTRTPAMVICPHCGGGLESGWSSWRCVNAADGCGRTFRALRGIPDLRRMEDSFLPSEADWLRATQLALWADQYDFPGLLAKYYELTPIEEVPECLRVRQCRHLQTAPDRAGGWLRALGADAENARGELPRPLLDLGCGSGSFLAAVRRSNKSLDLFGIDVAMRWLIIAQKRLESLGANDATLVCGNAEHLPFRDASIAVVIAGDVIEHVADQERTFVEAHRVLTPGGAFFLATPNRYSLTKEPHVQIWGVGYLPRRWMPGYVRALGGVEFRGVRTLGIREWRRLLDAGPFPNDHTVIRAPVLSAAERDQLTGLTRFLSVAYHAAISTPPGRWLALRIGPLFHIICRKEA